MLTLDNKLSFPGVCLLCIIRLPDAAIEEPWRLKLLINRGTLRTVGGQFSILISSFRSV
jgi:hypothetical protein